jgi:hypothetical protein
MAYYPDFSFVFAFQQKEMRSLRMFLMAFVPYVIVSFLNDLAQVNTERFL